MPSTTAPERRAAETTDGIHLTAAGYERWAVALDEMLRSLALD